MSGTRINCHDCGGHLVTDAQQPSGFDHVYQIDRGNCKSDFPLPLNVFRLLEQVRRDADEERADDVEELISDNELLTSDVCWLLLHCNPVETANGDRFWGLVEKYLAQ